MTQPKGTLGSLACRSSGEGRQARSEREATGTRDSHTFSRHACLALQARFVPEKRENIAPVLQVKKVLLNPESPKSDQHQVSPNNINR